MDNATHAMHSYIAIENPASPGTYVDVSNKASNARMPLTKADVDSSTFGQGDMTAVSGQRDGTFTLDTYNDDALATLLFAIYMSDDPVNVRYGPNGNGSGKIRFSADYIMTGWEPGGSFNSLVAGGVSFHRTGGTTFDTFA